MSKTLYKGIFCWHGEDFILYTHANSEKKAFYQFTQQLAERLEYSRSAIASYFLNTPRYCVEVEERT